MEYNEIIERMFDELTESECASVINELLESNNDFDSMVHPMDELDELLSETSATDAIRLWTFGSRYGTPHDDNNWNDDWFTFNGYGNISTIADLSEYAGSELCNFDCEEIIAVLEQRGVRIEDEDLYE